MTTICAWCQKEAGEKPQPGQSHGICPRHEAKLLAEAHTMFEGIRAKQRRRRRVPGALAARKTPTLWPAR